MHYDSYFGSKADGVKRTIVSLRHPLMTFGQRKGMSPRDWLALGQMYPCPHQQFRSLSPCEIESRYPGEPLLYGSKAALHYRTRKWLTCGRYCTSSVCPELTSSNCTVLPEGYKRAFLNIQKYGDSTSSRTSLRSVVHDGDMVRLGALGAESSRVLACTDTRRGSDYNSDCYMTNPHFVNLGCSRTGRQTLGPRLLDCYRDRFAIFLIDKPLGEESESRNAIRQNSLVAFCRRSLLDVTSNRLLCFSCRISARKDSRRACRLRPCQKNNLMNCKGVIFKIQRWPDVWKHLDGTRQMRSRAHRPGWRKRVKCPVESLLNRVTPLLVMKWTTGI